MMCARVDALVTHMRTQHDSPSVRFTHPYVSYHLLSSSLTLPVPLLPLFNRTVLITHCRTRTSALQRSLGSWRRRSSLASQKQRRSMLRSCRPCSTSYSFYMSKWKFWV